MVKNALPRGCKSALGDISALARLEIKIDSRIAKSPFLPLGALLKMCVPLSGSVFIMEKYGLLSNYISRIPVPLVTQDDFLFTANAMLTAGYSISKTRQFISFMYSCIKRYKAVTGFSDVPSRCFGLYSQDDNAVCAVYFETNERNRIAKEALRLYADMKPYYNLGRAVMFMMYTGLSLGSLAGLKNDCLSDGRLTVKSTAVSFGGEYSYLSGFAECPFKSVIELTGSAGAIAESVFASLPRYEEMKNSDGAARFKRSVNVAFDAILKNTMLYSKYADYGPSVLRNTFAVNCIINGVDTGRLSLMLGHPDEEFTRTVYLPYIK